MKNSHFNSLIHTPNRSHICAMLSTSSEIEFKLLRERLDVSDSVLSKHIKSLEEPSYVVLAKRKDFGHRRTRFSLISASLDGYTEHVKGLKRIVS